MAHPVPPSIRTAHSGRFNTSWDRTGLPYLGEQPQVSSRTGSSGGKTIHQPPLKSVQHNRPVIVRRITEHLKDTDSLPDKVKVAPTAMQQGWQVLNNVANMVDTVAGWLLEPIHQVIAQLIGVNEEFDDETKFQQALKRRLKQQASELDEKIDGGFVRLSNSLERSIQLAQTLHDWDEKTEKNPAWQQKEDLHKLAVLEFDKLLHEMHIKTKDGLNDPEKTAAKLADWFRLLPYVHCLSHYGDECGQFLVSLTGAQQKLVRTAVENGRRTLVEDAEWTKKFDQFRKK